MSSDDESRAKAAAKNARLRYAKYVADERSAEYDTLCGRLESEQLQCAAANTTIAIRDETIAKLTAQLRAQADDHIECTLELAEQANANHRMVAELAVQRDGRIAALRAELDQCRVSVDLTTKLDECNKALAASDAKASAIHAEYAGIIAHRDQYHAAAFARRQRESYVLFTTQGNSLAAERDVNSGLQSEIYGLRTLLDQSRRAAEDTTPVSLRVPSLKRSRF